MARKKFFDDEEVRESLRSAAISAGVLGGGLLLTKKLGSPVRRHRLASAAMRVLRPRKYRKLRAGITNRRKMRQWKGRNARELKRTSEIKRRKAMTITYGEG